MGDDKRKRDFRDRDRVSADEAYEVEHFAGAEVTKLGDLGPPISDKLNEVAENGHDRFYICPTCGQKVDTRDSRQVTFHQKPVHKPLEYDSRGSL